MAVSKGVGGGILLLIAGGFLILVGLIKAIPAFNLLGRESLLYKRWLIYFFQFRWISNINYMIYSLAYNFMQGIIELIALAGIMCLFIAMVFFIIGGFMAFGTQDTKWSMGMTAAVLFLISVATNICRIMITFRNYIDPFTPSPGTVFLAFIDTTAIIVLILGFVGAAQAKADT
ncbi:MAG: hypothetical protein HWN67_14545 [Candidatus Helarchaeota archaeon]|nr:hypothetical protein [Candidatus Helarchaeota archaeon]